MDVSGEISRLVLGPTGFVGNLSIGDQVKHIEIHGFADLADLHSIDGNVLERFAFASAVCQSEGEAGEGGSRVVDEEAGLHIGV